MRIFEEVVYLTDELLSPASNVCTLPPGLGIYGVCLKRLSGSFSFSPSWHPQRTKTAICAAVRSPRSVKYIPLQWSDTLSPRLRLTTSHRDSLTYVSPTGIHLCSVE